MMLGVFGSVDKIEMPLSIIDSLWTRKAIILWKDFENLPESLGIGYRGKEAIWLQKKPKAPGLFSGTGGGCLCPRECFYYSRAERKS